MRALRISRLYTFNLCIYFLVYLFSFRPAAGRGRQAWERFRVWRVVQGWGCHARAFFARLLAAVTTCGICVRRSLIGEHIEIPKWKWLQDGPRSEWSGGPSFGWDWGLVAGYWLQCWQSPVERRRRRCPQSSVGWPGQVFVAVMAVASR